MRFATPLAFAALLLVPLVFYCRWRRGRASRALGFSAIELLRPVAGLSWRQRFMPLPLYLRLLALVLLVFALARPQLGTEKIRDIRHGVAIEMVIDRSSSMGEEMATNRMGGSRLEVVKKIFAEFVNGNGADLAGRPSDLIGLVSFARFPETVCPLTLTHEAVNGFMTGIELVNRRDEDGTAIGDGLSLAAARLQKAEEEAARQQERQGAASYDIKSKIIILLTDGAHNAGTLSPLEAARLAARWGIKIYTIGIGDDIDPDSAGGFFALLNRPGRGVDKKTLQETAAATGGIFRMAADADSLRAIYAEIDRMEKSDIENVRYVDYAEKFPWFVLAALTLLATEMALRTTLLRKIP
jgi:Ca-activated chloride channel family protein